VHGLALEPTVVLYALVYLVVYGSAVLLGACAVFQRKELQ
jgi:hypothetical protein